MSRKPKEIYIPFNSSYPCPCLWGFGKQAAGEALNSHAKKKKKKINHLQLSEGGKKLKNCHIFWEVEKGAQLWCFYSPGPQPTALHRAASTAHPWGRVADGSQGPTRYFLLARISVQKPGRKEKKAISASRRAARFLQNYCTPI